MKMKRGQREDESHREASAKGELRTSNQSTGAGERASLNQRSDVASTSEAAKSSKRRKKTKKPPDMPTRPLSAYNLFFREERVRWLSERESAGTQGPKERGRGGAIFREMGRTIGKRWRELSADQRQKYDKLADTEMDSYRTAMNAYKVRQEEKLRETGRVESAQIGASETFASGRKPRAEQQLPVCRTGSAGGVNLGPLSTLDPRPNFRMDPSSEIFDPLSQLSSSTQAMMSLNTLIPMHGQPYLQPQNRPMLQPTQSDLARWMRNSEVQLQNSLGTPLHQSVLNAGGSIGSRAQPSAMYDLRGRTLASLVDSALLSQALLRPLPMPAGTICSSNLFPTSHPFLDLSHQQQSSLRGGPSHSSTESVYEPPGATTSRLNIPHVRRLSQPPTDAEAGRSRDQDSLNQQGKSAQE